MCTGLWHITRSTGLQHVPPVQQAKRVPATYVWMVLLCVTQGVLGHCSRGRQVRTVAWYVNAVS